MRRSRKEEYAKAKSERTERGLCIRGCGNPKRTGRLTCKTCADKETEYATANKEARESASLFHKYGITSADKKQMYADQKGLCGVCFEPMQWGRDCHVDHDHVTGRIRSLLHQRCNIFVGYLEDQFIEKAKAYLELHNVKEKD